jgi:predicted nucleotidyltransferase
MKNQNEEYIDRILEIIKDYPDILFCSIYGSMARNKLTKNSDIDIAMAGNSPITTEKLAELSIKFSDACHREIDLIDLQTKSGVLLQKVLCEGRVILKKSADLHAELIRKMWYNQADMMPNVRMIWEKRRGKITGAQT